MPGSKVGVGARFAGFERLNGTAGCHDDGQTSGTSNGFLRGGDDGVDAPFVEADFFAAYRADSVDDEEGVGRDLFDKFGERLNLGEDTSGGVGVCDGDDFVLFLLQRLFDLVELRAVTDGCLELCGLDTICLEAIGEAVGKVARVEDESVIARLSQVGGDLVPTEGT